MQHLFVALPGNTFGQPVAAGALNTISLRAAFIVIRYDILCSSPGRKRRRHRLDQTANLVCVYSANLVTELGTTL
jgi:hypothetical protein